MANDAEAAAAIHTIDEYLKGVNDAVSDEVKEYWWIKNKGKMKFNQGGRGQRWVVALERGTVHGYARETVLDVARVNRNQEARLTNKGYGMAELVHWTDIIENKGTPQIVEHLKDLLEGMTRDYFVELTYGLFVDGPNSSRADSLGFIGLDGAILATGNTYAGISTTTYAGWQGQVPGSVAPYTQFSQDPMKALNAAIRTTIKGTNKGLASDQADVAWLSRANYDVIIESFARGHDLAKDKEAANFGWHDQFKYRGVTFFPSDYVGDADVGKDLYLWNTKNMDLRFPTGKMIVEDRFTEGFPRSQILMLITYGLLRFKLPRTFGRFDLT